MDNDSKHPQILAFADMIKAIFDQDLFKEGAKKSMEVKLKKQETNNQIRLLHSLQNRNTGKK